jgi:hypothetical protein
VCVCARASVCLSESHDLTSHLKSIHHQTITHANIPCRSHSTGRAAEKRRGRPPVINGYGVISNRFGVRSNRYGVTSNGFGVISNGYGVIRKRFDVLSNKICVMTNALEAGNTKWTNM